ncbi:MAG: oxidoreductase [Alphaproteobacteria bacterium]|nr:MAG: oxidoreductase [Alphaproteobacteria bacterium]
MEYRKLGRTDIEVSRICLGTMTWGSQNSEAEAHRQMDYALDHGVTFCDTAEMYPTTPRAAETVGRTEEFIGSWLAQTGRRHEVVLATKIAGNGSITRGGEPITAASIGRALEGSLRRLKTDHVDLYQLHWPNRGSYHFRQAWSYDPSTQPRRETLDNIAEVLDALGRLVAAGKVRAIGLSNETAWGTMQFLRLADANGLPRVASVQNEYSLLNRLADTDLAELCHHEEVGLMAFSPLAAGLLSGKYLSGTVPPGSRMSIQPDLYGRYNVHSKPAIAAYAEIARRHGLNFAQMSLAFCLTRPFMMSVIIGATSMDQLATDIGAAEVRLSDAVMAEIAEVRRQYPMPM